MFYLESFFVTLNSFFNYLLVSLTIIICPTTSSISSGSENKSSFARWQAEQTELDAIRGVDDWLAADKDRRYNWRVLGNLKHDLQKARHDGNYISVCSQVRAQSSRNMCGLLSPALYRKSQIRTKRLIHDYILEVSRCIWFIAKHENTLLNPSLDKVQVLHDMRQSLGRTSLVLQGGAMVSLCHLGVVRALIQQRLLPQIITGTATGALIAALVSATPDDRLGNMLLEHDISIEVFMRAKARRQPSTNSWTRPAWVETILRRWARYRTTGHFFNIDVLRECARDNLGDITFEEAYAKTGRILNITIAMSDVAGTPQLLNYITAPHVLLWSAVMASIATSKQMYAPVKLFCKSRTGEVVEYYAADSLDSAPHRPNSAHYEAPLQRIGELFNVNHFIVSQTRPYILPFIQLQRAADNNVIIGAVVRSMLNEGLHWLEVAGRIGMLPSFLQRILVDEVVPSFAPWSKMNIIPRLGIQDAGLVFDNPTPAALEKWTRRGEESTWPAICELKIRCAIELELEAAYDRVRRRSG